VTGGLWLMTRSDQLGRGQKFPPALTSDPSAAGVGPGIAGIASPAPLAGRVDEPVAAFGLLQRRLTLAITGVLLALAALAWYLTWRQTDAATMGGMSGMGPPSAALFLPMWVTMMVAMMFPTILPIVLTHRAVVARRGE
jgi:hypothetical protein